MVRFIYSTSQGQASSSPLGRFLARVLAWLIWVALAFIGLLFMLALLGGFLVILLFSLVKGWVTGQPSAPAQLWQAWRQTARQRWTHTTGTRPNATTSAPEPPQAAQRSAATDVQDVSWRELPARPAGKPSGEGPDKR